jgi:ArsR family transcriptional regulator, arsenate/arsenite/antimonite-responsive transcriptional repressor
MAAQIGAEGIECKFLHYGSLSRSGRPLHTSTDVDIFMLMTVRPRPGRTLPGQIFHALSDETRLQILQCLRGGERCVCELTDALDTAQSLLSFHLKVLKDAGLVADRREGRWMYYTLDRTTLGRCGALIEDLVQEPTAAERPERCC